MAASIPARMTAIAVKDGKGAAEALVAVDAAVPQAGPGQVLIRVRAAGKIPGAATHQGD